MKPGPCSSRRITTPPTAHARAGTGVGKKILGYSPGSPMYTGTGFILRGLADQGEAAPTLVKG